MRLARTTPNVFAAVVAGLLVGIWDWSDRVSAQAAAENTNNARAGVCEREAEKLLGQRPVRIGGSIRPPKPIRDVAPRYPEQPPGTIGSGMWIGEALVNNSGRVTRVWPIREVMFKPAFPAFNNLVAEAIYRREYEPVIVDGKPAPFCMTVSVNINWK